MQLWRKDGGPPKELPFVDFDAERQAWSDLANNEEGREACGWTPAPPQPDHDPETDTPVWDAETSSWALESRTPETVSRLQLRLELFNRGMLDDAEAAVAAAGGETAIYWQDTCDFHLHHPVLQSFVGGKPEWTQALFAEIFTAAKARG